MTPRICILPAAVAALTVGHMGIDLKLTGGGMPFPQDYTMLAANGSTKQGTAQPEDRKLSSTSLATTLRR
jgi:hypothetical protein